MLPHHAKNLRMRGAKSWALHAYRRLSDVTTDLSETIFYNTARRDLTLFVGKSYTICLPCTRLLLCSLGTRRTTSELISGTHRYIMFICCGGGNVSCRVEVQNLKLITYSYRIFRNLTLPTETKNGVTLIIMSISVPESELTERKRLHPAHFYTT